MRRGVLLDIAGLEGVDVLPVDFEVTPDHLSRAANTEINEGDIVLLRDRVYELVFVAALMNIRGGTGAPVRPLAFPRSQRT
jgi:hypothetical protein